MARQDEYDDDRTVIIRRDNGNAGVGMLLLGLAIGAGAALLFAPASGEETRERLQREARRAGRKVKDMTDAVTEEVSDRVSRTRSRFDERVERARGTMGARVDRARDAVGSRISAMSEAVDGGREAADDARAHLAQAVLDAKRAYAESRRAYRESRFARSIRDTMQDDVAPLADAAPKAIHDDVHGSAAAD